MKRFDDEVLYENVCPAVLEADNAGKLLQLEAGWPALLPVGTDLVDCYTELRFTPDGGGEVLRDIGYLIELSQLASLRLPASEISVGEPQAMGCGVIRLEISVSAFVPFLRVGVLGCEARMADNYFSMEAGETRTLDISLDREGGGPVTLFLEAPNAGWKVLRRWM